MHSQTWDFHGGSSHCTRRRHAPHLRSLQPLSSPPAAPQMSSPWSCCRTSCPAPGGCLSSRVQVCPQSPESLTTGRRGSACTLAPTGDPCSTRSLSAAPGPDSATGPGTSLAGRSSRPTSRTRLTESCGGGRREARCTGWSRRTWTPSIPRRDRRGWRSCMAVHTGVKPSRFTDCGQADRQFVRSGPASRHSLVACAILIVFIWKRTVCRVPVCPIAARGWFTLGVNAMWK